MAAVDGDFWDRLGRDDGGLPEHLPMGVNQKGQGPVEPEPPHHYECWCGDRFCPLTIVLRQAHKAALRGIRIRVPIEDRNSP